MTENLKPGINPGDVVFFKQAKKTSRATKRESFTFQGHAYGILLGHTPLFQQDPNAVQIFRQLGGLGFLSFDDAIEFLGEECGTMLVKKFEDKYYGKAIDPAQQALPLPADSVQPESSSPPVSLSKIVGLNGAPLMSAQAPPPDAL